MRILMILTLNQKQKFATQFALLTEIPVRPAGNALSFDRDHSPMQGYPVHHRLARIDAMSIFAQQS